MNICGTCKYFGVRLESWKQGESTPTNYAFCQLLTHMRATIYGGREEVLSETDVEGCPEALTAIAGPVDMSGCFAALCVREDFGCNQWTAANAGAEQR